MPLLQEEGFLEREDKNPMSIYGRAMYVAHEEHLALIFALHSVIPFSNSGGFAERT